MFEWLNPMWLGCSLAVIGAGYFLLQPLLILFNQKMEATPEIVEYHSGVATPPKAAARFFDECGDGLEACGFRRISSVVLPNPMPNVFLVLELFVHDRNRDAAMVVAIFGITSDMPPLQMRYVEIIGEFCDHELEMVVTNNNDEVGAFPDRSEAPTYRLPRLRDVEQLYYVHQRLVERHAPGVRKQLTVFEEFGGDVAEYVKSRILRKSFQHQQEAGTLRYDPESDCFVPTFFGAYRMAWRLMWPMKQMIQARYESQGRRLHAEFLDGEDWDDEN